ncbi:MAG TPA: SDR family NAD(P)-dependent oxidoreductase [Solirubrobacteraceae bacterium]|nr:SDR family NAD(P)-dependent oxidoreductase [Solirubrobacteraceae bacterium]
MDLQLEGKVALVTGAGQYMGRAMAIDLAAEGARVAVNDIVADKADAVVAEIAERGGTAIPAVADVTDREAIDALVASIGDELGPVDILVNNAGLPVPQDEGDTMASRTANLFVDSDPEWWKRWVDINYFGTLNCSRAVLEGMRERQTGRIINIVSDAARIGEPRQAVYAGAKAGIVGFSKSIAREMGRYGITVNCISLGAVLHKEWVEDATPEAEERRRKALRVYPLGRALNRFGVPEDASYAVVLFASPRAEWITGQVLSVSGGFTTVG